MYLVDDNDICELNLIDHEICDCTFIFRRLDLRSKALVKKFDSLELFEEAECINNGDCCVDLGDGIETSTLGTFDYCQLSALCRFIY